MSAKQVLLDYVSNLTEEQALQKLPLIADAGTPPVLTSGEKVVIEQALARLDAGEKTSHAEMKRRFGLS
jgi:hypothetical protein